MSRILEIGYKEKGSFAFSIKSKNILFGETIRIQVSAFKENFIVFVKRGEDSIVKGNFGTLICHPKNGYNIDFRYEFTSEFSHGNDEVSISVNGVEIQVFKVNFYKNEGKLNYSQNGNELIFVIEGTATDIKVNGEDIYYYKRGNLTFAKSDLIKNPEITYRQENKLFAVTIYHEDNKLGNEPSTLIIGNQNYTASLYTGLSKGKTYNFVNDGIFYSLDERYYSFQQVQGAKQLYPIGDKVVLHPKEKINHYAVLRNDKVHPLTIIAK